MEQISIKKAVAIFDMPSCCMDCQISIHDSDSMDYTCPFTGECSNIDNAEHERGELCPLKEMEVAIKIDI